MNKYTASDFANARFAEHPDGDFAARFDPDSPDPWLGTEECAYTDRDMANAGWVPAPTKHTITESEYRKGTGNFGAFAKFGFDTALIIAGVEVTPDPEPTNAEKLADVYRSWCGRDEVPNSLIRFMDEAGVTAPEETK